MAVTWTLHIQPSDDDATTRVLALGATPVRVGRGIHCEVRLNQVGLGDVQCTLRRRGDEWQVQPIGPPGRIWVDNRPTETQRPLPVGVPLRVGRATLTIHETDPNRRERGSFDAPITVDAEPVESNPIPQFSSPPEPEPAPPSQPSSEPTNLDPNDDRVKRWQTRLDQRDQWLKDRQSEKRWEARWKAAGETLRARSAPPVPSPSTPAPPRVEPTPPPAPVRPTSGRPPSVRSSEPRSVFGHLKRVADPDRTTAPPRVSIRPSTVEPPAPPVELVPEIDSNPTPPVPSIGSSTTDFDEVNAVLAELNPPFAPATVEAKIEPTEQPSGPGGTGSVLRPRASDIDNAGQLDSADGTPWHEVGVPNPTDPGESASPAPPIDEIRAEDVPVEIAPRSIILATSEPIAAEPPAPVRVPRLKPARRVSPPAEPPVDRLVPAPTLVPRAAELDEPEPGDDGIGSIPPEGPVDGTASGVGKLIPAPRIDAAAEVAKPTPQAQPRPGPQPAARLPESKEWPSARTIFAAQGTRGTGEATSHPQPTAGPARPRPMPEPTDPVRPGAWTIPLALGWLPTAALVAALGCFAVGLAVVWLEDASSGNIAVRLATRPEGAHSPVIDPQTIPRSAWWQTTASHLAAWALTLERVGNGEDRSVEARAPGSSVSRSRGRKRTRRRRSAWGRPATSSP